MLCKKAAPWLLAIVATLVSRLVVACAEVKTIAPDEEVVCEMALAYPAKPEVEATELAVLPKLLASAVDR